MCLRIVSPVLLLALVATGMATPRAQAADEIVHDAEYYVLEAQHGVACGVRVLRAFAAR